MLIAQDLIGFASRADWHRTSSWFASDDNWHKTSSCFASDADWHKTSSWFVSDADCTRLNLYLSAYWPELTLDCQFNWNLNFSRDFRLFGHFLPSQKAFWCSCSSQAFCLWFSYFRQSHIWHSMQLLCNVSFMYDHAWMKCPCIKSIFHLLDLPHFLFTCTSPVNFSDLLCFFHILS